MPKVPVDDEAFKSRCIILDFLAKFVENPQFERQVEDIMGKYHQAEYKKDILTEK